MGVGGNRIEGNTVRDHPGKGIVTTSGVDIIIRNASGNNASGNFSPTTGYYIGPIEPPSASSNPMANIVF